MTEQDDIVEELEASAKLYDNAGLDGEFGANLMRTAKAEITRLQAELSATNDKLAKAVAFINEHCDLYQLTDAELAPLNEIKGE